MPLVKKPMRYAHPEGHTDVCYYTGEEGGLITCGSDGDVRSWLNLMDDDPTASCIAEQAIALISKKGKIYVGNDNNTVQILTHPDLEKEGIVTRFAAPVCALATTTNSNYIVSGGCDMRIQITNINTSHSIELEGHEAPILGLSLDPKEEFVASSSADGSIRIWDIKEKCTVNIWNNVVPKCNSFFTAKTYCTPSFHCKDGSCLAYPHNKDIIIVERLTWKESYKLQCPTLKAEFSICKFSDCGTRLAASTVYGEIVAWNMENMALIGNIEHPQNTKITAIVWKHNASDEIAFCDFSGQLGCIDVIVDNQSEDLQSNGLSMNNEVRETTEIPLNYINDDDDDDGDNVISLNKIKASVGYENDEKSDIILEKDTAHDVKNFMPEIRIQPPFQPGSSPIHLLSRFMVWNHVGIVKCFNSEDGEESSIEVEFHDITIHRSMHINNYLNHTIAALSSNALVLNCPSIEDTASKLVVVVLQGWGSGNKEWSIDLPEGEDGQCVAAGDNFVAIATSRRYLRIFMIGGTQREVIALPGPVVTMNAFNNHLVVAYHDGLGVTGDQHMSLLCIQIFGTRLRNQKLSIPLCPSSDLIWLGLSDFGSPVITDSEDIIKIYDKKSSLWRVICDMDRKGKGKADHYFIIEVSEERKSVSCVLCKGSYYPITTPRPVVTEISLTIPLCEPDSEKTEKETKLWQLGSQPSDENEAVLFLIALACRSNVEYRAVELCEQIASQKVLDLAIKYAARINRTALMKKLESIADIKEKQEEEEKEEKENNDQNGTKNGDEIIEDTEELFLTPVVNKKSDIEIRPLSMTETLSMRRSNPFLKTTTSTSTGLIGLNTAQEKPQRSVVEKITPSPKFKSKNEVKKETFVAWYAKQKKHLQEEFPDYKPAELTKIALSRYKEISKTQDKEEPSEKKKRKLSNHIPLDVIQDAMGIMGPWHIVIAIALSLVKFPVAWHQLSIVFLAPPTNFSCISPESSTNESMVMKCYVNLDNGTMEKCNKFRYDRRIFRESIITEWDLVCDREQLANVVQSCTMFGVLLGNFVFSSMADRIGRKKPLMIALALQSVTGVISSYAVWFELFLIFKFLSAIATGGTMLISFVLLMEIVGIEWRSAMSILFHVPFIIGHLTTPLVSYLTHTWHKFQLAISIPAICLLSYYWIIPESPRWLLATGKPAEAEIILLKAARRNKIPLENVNRAIDAHESQKLSRKIDKTNYNFTHLFRTPNMRFKSICVFINWFFCGICFFGLAQYMGHIDGNIFINVAISAAVELPGTIIVLFLISRVSRLKILMGANLLTGLSLLLIVIINNPNATLYLASLGIAGTGVSFPTIYLYSSEIFPTVVRNNGIGIGSVCARFGSMIAPYIATLGKIQFWLPPVIFGLGQLIGAGLCLLLPETINCELPETIEDGENFRKQTSAQSTSSAHNNT
ncbi:PREDICTED: WD repeat and HMG-box DNA-binding protein 1-like [Polistes canadensis]|uniref:WD repeat and HMG-box DNA-binding protein 1-like n=1 Tax=Polistes canadensis TaxID=91411 RepID=UPI000718C20A|nr:PREDICTED: WD repeat and HMG-box DNA-binding protein 1-like [Polistes canadensis]